MTVKIEELIFDKDGLIPAIVTDVNTGKVLTLAYMNRESLETVSYTHLFPAIAQGSGAYEGSS